MIYLFFLPNVTFTDFINVLLTKFPRSVPCCVTSGISDGIVPFTAVFLTWSLCFLLFSLHSSVFEVLSVLFLEHCIPSDCALHKS